MCDVRNAREEETEGGIEPKSDGEGAAVGMEEGEAVVVEMIW